MITIKRKSGWELNQNDKVVNSILRLCENNGGLCPCHHVEDDYNGKDLHCPCSDYLMKDNCVCGLYIKIDG